jgi:DNA-binding transcriptional regulator YiaG
MTDVNTLVKLARVRDLVRSGAAKSIRRTHGLTASDVARGVGVAVPTVLRWEAGQRVPRGLPALKYGELLDVLLSGTNGNGRS